MARTLFILIVLFVVHPAGAISRVGTCGIIDHTEGFSVEAIPAGYRDISTISRSGIQLSATKLTSGKANASTEYIPTPVDSIQIYPVRYAYPELTGLGRISSRTLLAARGAKWEQLTVGDPNLLVMSTVNAGLRTTIVKWGPLLGIVIHSSAGAKTDGVVIDLIAQIKLKFPVPARW